MGFIALMMFIYIFGWGHETLSWIDTGNSVQRMLLVCFILGLVTGYQVAIKRSGI